MRARRSWIVLIVTVMSLGMMGGIAGAQPDAPRARVQDYFSDEEIARAQAYRGPRLAFGLTSLGLTVLVLALLAFGPLARRLGDVGATRRWPVHALVLVAVVTLVPWAVTLPLSLLRWRHDRAYGLATNSVGAVLADAAKSVGIQVIISAIAALGFLAIARALPRGWPVPVAAAGAGLVILLVFLLPVVYEPVFNKFTPVDPATRDRIVALARSEGVQVRDVVVADASRRTTRKNAYVSGIGSTRRVVLYDTLLETSPPAEVDAVVAHELAHVKHADVMRGTVLGVIGVFLGVAVLWLLLRWAGLLRLAGASGPGDPRIIALLAFFVFVSSIVTLPITNAISRNMEARADRTAIATTGDAEAAIRLEVDLARTNLADLTPNGFVRWMFFTHPSTIERIQIALDAQARS